MLLGLEEATAALVRLHFFWEIGAPFNHLACRHIAGFHTQTHALILNCDARKRIELHEYFHDPN